MARELGAEAGAGVGRVAGQQAAALAAAEELAKRNMAELTEEAAAQLRQQFETVRNSQL